MPKTTLSYKTMVPKLKHLAPAPAVMMFVFDVNEKDLNPLFLQELSDRVRDDYLIPLDKTWGAAWEKWDAEFDRMLPGCVFHTASARKKLIDTLSAPYHKEYDKQMKNIESMAKTVADRYWAEIARQHSEITTYKVKTGAKVAWKGLMFAGNVATIVQSGGTAVASYLQALRKLYQIYGVYKDYCSSAADYQLKVYKHMEAIKTSMWKANGLHVGISKKQIEPDKKNLAELKKYTKDSKSDLAKLESDLSTFGAKVSQLHIKAGEISKELDKVLNVLEDALEVDPKIEEKHRSQIMSLILDTKRLAGDAKSLEQFRTAAQKYCVTTAKTIRANETYLSQAGGGAKWLTTLALKELAEIVAKMTADIAAGKVLTGEVITVGTMLKGMKDKVEAGLKVVDVLISVF